MSGLGNAFLTDVTVRAGGAFVDKLLADTSQLCRPSIRVLGVLRAGERLRPHDDLVLQAGDRLVLQAPAEEVLTLEETDGLEVGGRRWVREGNSAEEATQENATVEAFVAPRRAGRETRISDLGLDRRFGVRVLGVSRHRHVPGPDLASVRLRAADRLLLQGPAEGIAAIADETGLVAVRAPRARSFRRRRAPLAILAMLSVVVLAAFGVMDISGLAILAVAAILVLACIDPEEVWQSIDGSVLLLIFAMLAVGRGLENTQAIAAVVGVVQGVLEGTPPFVVLLGLYLLTSVLTEMISNAAVAVLLTPVAIGLGNSLGVEPRTLVLAVMFGASASFATPIGYQTNTLVYGAGNYTFTDFLRIGIPMNLAVGGATCAALAASSWLPLGGD